MLKMQEKFEGEETKKFRNKSRPSLPHLKKQFLDSKEIVTP